MPSQTSTRSRATTRGRHALRPSSSNHDDSTSPTLDRSRPLPNGRAVVGALLVTVAAVGTFAAYRSATEGPSSPVVVAAGDLPSGHHITATELRTERAELPPGAASRVFDSPSRLEGAVTVAPVHAGELIQSSSVVLAPDQEPPGRSFSFGVERERALNGDLQRGEHVDVLATFGSGEGASTAVVARDVTLVDVDAGAKSSAIGASGKLTVTVNMSSGDDVLRLAHATAVAPITLVRTTRSAGSDPGALDSYRQADSRSGAGAPEDTHRSSTSADPPASTTARGR